MTQTDLRNFYGARRAHFTSLLASLNKQINLISNFRLAVAIAFLILLYFTFSYRDLSYILLPLLIAFILLVRKHAVLFRRKVQVENLKRIQENELAVLQRDFSGNSSGSDFIDIHHPFTHDLDIFGAGSLFQYLNRCHTPSGKQHLAHLLSSTCLNEKEIRRRQDAVGELAAKSDFRQHIEALTMQIDEHPGDHQSLAHWLAQRPFLYGKVSYRFVLNIFPVLTVGLVVAAFMIDGITGYAVLCATLQWAFLGFHLKRINAFHQYIGRKKNILEKYAGVLSSIRAEKYASPLMQSMHATAEAAGEKLKQLAALVGAFDARMNVMTNLITNSLLLYDLQCVYRLEKWKEEHAAELPQWLDTAREVEVLCTLSTFAFNHPAFVFPEINASGLLSAKDLGHPLLEAEERVTNDLELSDNRRVMIITGANMAGKSTFLRAVGVNVVLAGAGVPVCATAFRCPPIELRSGMRTADSLKAHQSYFYAELDRLKSIMDDLRAGKPLLILLDEILKGTNSTDKQAGSVALVRQLVEHRCLALIATHDLGLGNLENAYQGRIVNYSFEATIENDQLSFDYKLKPGLAQKMNATFLMRKMGIIKEP